MRITIDSSLRGGGTVDVDVRPGTPLSAILAAVGASASRPWCGPQRLSADHRAGAHPLIHGALLTSEPGETPVAPVGPHLAVVAGPDAGAVIALDEPRTIGRAGADLTVDDPALSRVHASARISGDVAVLADRGSTNGVSVVGARGPLLLAARGERRLAPGERARLGDTVVEVRALGEGEGEQATTPDARAGSAAKRGGAMIGAGMSAIVLAAITGRWYLALLALVVPAATLAPELLRRLRPAVDVTPSALPDPTRPGSAPASATVAIVGSGERPTALARAEILARGRRPPARADGLDEAWLAWLPPAERGDGDLALVSEVPSWASRMLRLTEHGVTLMSEGRRHSSPVPLGVSEQRAELAARRLAGAQLAAQLPASVRWADLDPPPTSAAGARRLSAAIGVSAGAGGSSATWQLDLDAHGPHVLVAGTTGSGKSALLETLILSLCATWGPQDLRLALLDFKGGAGLGACAALPHVAGVVTDLDARQARRALAAIGAELADRKAALAQAGHSSFADWEAAGAAPARLLVVVDEFQEVAAVHRDFLPDLTRLAAQGRSLGMHLILATQRPSGAVTPEIRANTGATIALRVTSDAESRDLIGTGAAAALPTDCPGRAIVAWGEARVPIQVALPSATPTPAVRIVGSALQDEQRHLAEHVRELHSLSQPSPRLWHDPLPAVVSLANLDGEGAIPLGLADRAASRSRSVLEWDPLRGPLVIAGPAGSERDRALHAVVSGAPALGLTPVWLPRDAREAARTLALAQARPDVLLVVRDAASALAALVTVDRGAAAEALIARAAAGRSLALGIGSGSPHRIASNVGVKIVLAGLAPQDDAVWGVPRELQSVPAEPGAARAWDSDGWAEVRLADAREEPGVSLVAALPEAVEGLPQGAVGIGGDDARVFALPPDAVVTVVGPAGRVRDAVAELMTQAGADTVQCADAPLLMPPRARDGVVIAVEPNPRVAEDLCRASAAGLVDPAPKAGRVLWVDGGVGACVQLALPARVQA